MVTSKAKRGHMFVWNEVKYCFFLMFVINFSNTYHVKYYTNIYS